MNRAVPTLKSCVVKPNDKSWIECSGVVHVLEDVRLSPTLPSEASGTRLDVPPLNLELRLRRLIDGEQPGASPHPRRMIALDEIAPVKGPGTAGELSNITRELSVQEIGRAHV